MGEDVPWCGPLVQIKLRSVVDQGWREGFSPATERTTPEFSTGFSVARMGANRDHRDWCGPVLSREDEYSFVLNRRMGT